MRYTRNPVIKSEVELCHLIKPLLEADGSVLYPEVMGMDYLAVKDNLYIAIEVKTVMCAKVVEQAWERKHSGLVDGATILIPHDNFVRANKKFWIEICTKLGLGIMTYHYGGLKTIVTMSLSPREKEDITPLLRPEALVHTEAGLPSCKRWGELDLIQCKYLDYIGSDNCVDLDNAIKNVQPEFVGKRGGVLQKGRDYVAMLILGGRWPKLRLSHGTLRKAEA